MLLKVIDALGAPQTIIVHGQEAVVDHSGTITVGTGNEQLALDANALRSGWLLAPFVSPLWVNPFGGTPTAGEGSFLVAAGDTFPPPGFPITTDQINVMGTAGAAFTLKEW